MDSNWFGCEPSAKWKWINRERIKQFSTLSLNVPTRSNLPLFSTFYVVNIGIFRNKIVLGL